MTTLLTAQLHETTLKELNETCTSCTNHKPQRDNYAAPVSVEHKGRPLLVSDMPMETFMPVDLAQPSVPWNDGIKNFVMDMVSLKYGERFSVCMILCGDHDDELDYERDILNLTSWSIGMKYGKSGSTIIVVRYSSATECMHIQVLTEGKAEITNVVESDMLVRTLFKYYVEDDTFILCHDSSIAEYRNVLETLSGSTWSVSCTPLSYVESCDELQQCKYICAVFSHWLSRESRAVGRGMLTFDSTTLLDEYIGRMNYYSRCIRGIRCTTGRCYDCKMLYDVLVGLGGSMASNDAYKVTFLK